MSGHFICERCGCDGAHADYCVCLRPANEQWKGHRTEKEMQELKASQTISGAPPMTPHTDAGALRAVNSFISPEHTRDDLIVMIQRRDLLVSDLKSVVESLRQASQGSAGGEREAIARIVDPGPHWDRPDDYEPIYAIQRRRMRDAALKKADAILALPKLTAARETIEALAERLANKYEADDNAYRNFGEARKGTWREVAAFAFMSGCDGNPRAVIKAAKHAEPQGLAEIGWNAALDHVASLMPDAAQAVQEPVAFVVYASNGNVRLWSQTRDVAEPYANARGLTCVPLYASPVPSADREGK